jgi:hypothetical protein
MGKAHAGHSASFMGFGLCASDRQSAAKFLALKLEAWI